MSAVAENTTSPESPEVELNEASTKPPLRLGSVWKGRAKWNLDRWATLLTVIEDHELAYKQLDDLRLRRGLRRGLLRQAHAKLHRVLRKRRG